MPLSSSNWQIFYEIVGSAAGALTGLQFIVITLIAQTRATGSMREISAFGTPTVAHFCTALLTSALMVMPWRESKSLGIFLGLGGLAGIAYCLRVLWHARKSTYNPDVEDWFWYAALPIVAHLALVFAAGSLWWNTFWPPFVVAFDSLLFLLLGIHNSWDTVTYIALQYRNASPDRSAGAPNTADNTSEAESGDSC